MTDHGAYGNKTFCHAQLCEMSSRQCNYRLSCEFVCFPIKEYGNLAPGISYSLRVMRKNGVRSLCNFFRGCRMQNGLSCKMGSFENMSRLLQS